MNTTQLDCFLTVAETLSFARAAERLNITQPAVSHQIHTLEDELGAKLFHRTTRMVELTPAGLQFIHDAKDILSIARRAKRRLERPSPQDTVEFPIGCHSYALLSALSGALGALAEQIPGLRPQLRVVPFLHLFRLLENEEVEAVVGYQGQEGRRSSDGNYQEAGKVPLVCICPRTSPLSGRSSLRLGDLDGQRLILQDPIKCPPALSRLQGELVQDRAPSELYFCSGMDEALCLAQAGLGLALAPALLPPMEPLVAYLPVTEVPPLSFGAFFRTRKGTPHGRALLALLRERFSAPGAP